MIQIFSSTFPLSEPRRTIDEKPDVERNKKVSLVENFLKLIIKQAEIGNPLAISRSTPGPRSGQREADGCEAGHGQS